MASKPVPPSFLCPISLEVMKDPVTLSTGHTYERSNIEKWLRSGHNTCPVTMMQLQDATLIPNVIVRRLIRAWCADNGWKRSFKGEHIAPSSYVDVRDTVLSFLKEIARGQAVLAAVKGMKELARESEENRTCIVNTGGPLLLISLLCVQPTDIVHEECEACEDALCILALLCRNNSEIKTLAMEQQKLLWIVWHLRRGPTTGTKLAAASLIRYLVKQDDYREAVGKTKGLFEGLVALLIIDDLRSKAEKLLVKVLSQACELRSNRVRAIEAGAINALVCVLSRPRKVNTERAFCVLHMLCETIEGKVVASRHPEFLKVVSEKMVRESPLITEHAVSCTLEVCSWNRKETLRLALDSGIYQQLLLILQSDNTSSTKFKAQELLKLFHVVLGYCNI